MGIRATGNNFSMFTVVLLVTVALISLLITRLATIALTVTGLSRQSARFQARSALTGTGFTTSEAERVVDHPLRRRIVLFLMLIGNAGIVTIIGTLMLSFVGSRRGTDTLLRLGLLLGGLLGVLLLARSERIDRALTRLIAQALRRYTDLDVRDYARLLKLSGDYAVTEMTVNDGDWVADRSLLELQLTDEGIIVLGVQRADGDYLGVPRGDTPIQVGDTLIVYGRGQRLAELDRRRAGAAGDRAHNEAVIEQRVVLNVEAHGDAARGASPER